MSCFFVVCVCILEHHRTRLVCENERLKLVCKNETVLTIYSATFGHLLHGSPYCPSEPGSHVEMGAEQVKLTKTSAAHSYSPPSGRPCSLRETSIFDVTV